MADALDRAIVWESKFASRLFSDPWDSWSPLRRAVVWYVLGMFLGLGMAWSEGWPSTEETLQGMFGVGLICASVSLFVSLARWIFVAVTVGLRQPKDEHA